MLTGEQKCTARQAFRARRVFWRERIAGRRECPRTRVPPFYFLSVQQEKNTRVNRLYYYFFLEWQHDWNSPHGCFVTSASHSKTNLTLFLSINCYDIWFLRFGLLYGAITHRFVAICSKSIFTNKISRYQSSK